MPPGSPPRQTLTDPDGRVSTYQYDALNRLTRLEHGYGEVTTLSYDALGRETERVLANGVGSSRAYDAAGRETVLAHVADGAALAWYTATYDAAGSRTGVVELDGTAVTYTHDALGQLTGEARGAVSTAFVYDPMGNRVTKTVDGATTTSTYNAANELTLVTPPTGPATTLTHDAAGNVTVENTGGALTTYTWDGESRLTRVDGPDGTEEYAYDADGLRVRKETAGGTVHYVMDGANVLIETDGSLVTQAVYTDLPGEWGSKFSLRRAGASWYYLPDHQGHNRQLTDEAGDLTDSLLCDAWGVQVMEAGLTANPFAAFGQWGYYTDAPERLYVRARHYAPEAGRWLSADPLGWDAGDLNLYRYVGNAPTAGVDPSGLVTLGVDYCGCPRSRWKECRRPTSVCANGGVWVCVSCYNDSAAGGGGIAYPGTPGCCPRTHPGPRIGDCAHDRHCPVCPRGAWIGIDNGVNIPGRVECQVCDNGVGGPKGIRCGIDFYVPGTGDCDPVFRRMGYGTGWYCITCHSLEPNPGGDYPIPMPIPGYPITPHSLRRPKPRRRV